MASKGRGGPPPIKGKNSRGQRAGELNAYKKAARRLKTALNRICGLDESEDPVSRRTSVLWAQDAERICAPNQQPRCPDMAALLDTLQQSRTAAAFVSAAKDLGYTFEFDDQNSNSQCYVDKRLITIHPNKAKPVQLLAFIDALHFAWMARDELLLNPLKFEPDEAILFNRAQKANILLAKIKIALECRFAGEDMLWSWLKRTPARHIMKIVQSEVTRDFRSLNNGYALCLAYNHYFESSLVRIHDRKLIHDMLLDEGGYVFSGVDPEYHVSDDVLVRLGAFPFGTNHILTLMKTTSPSNPEYWVVDERSNANFLWFIKFERSFQIQEHVAKEKGIEAEIIDLSAWQPEKEPPVSPKNQAESPKGDVVLFMAPGQGDFSGFQDGLF